MTTIDPLSSSANGICRGQLSATFSLAAERRPVPAFGSRQLIHVERTTSRGASGSTRPPHADGAATFLGKKQDPVTAFTQFHRTGAEKPGDALDFRGLAPRQHVRSRQPEVMVGCPSAPDMVLFHQRKARCIDVGELGTTKPIQNLTYLLVMLRIRIEDMQPIETIEEYAKCPGGIFSMFVQEPRVGFRTYESGSTPPNRGIVE